MIENLVEEAKIKLENGIKASDTDLKKQNLHEKLSEQKKEYIHHL